ncbi:MAG TPA: hypothetical protein VGC35_06110 [Allosphingosinicella sp.]|jgi:hypothetical protein
MGIKLVEQCLSICDELAKEAADLVEPCDERKVAAFAEKLCGLEGLDYKGMRERLSGVEMPGDFRHLRITNLSTAMDWGGRYNMHHESITVDDVLRHMACTVKLARATPGNKGGVWTKTVALPITDPGVLELGVIFRTRS